MFLVGNYITLPVGFIDDMLAYIGDLFTDVSLLLVLILGLPVAFWVVRKVISLVRVRA